MYAQATKIFLYFGIMAQVMPGLAQSPDPIPLVEITMCRFVSDKGEMDLSILNQQWKEWADEIGAIDFTRSTMTPFLSEEGVGHNVVSVIEYPSAASMEKYVSVQEESGSFLNQAFDEILECDSSIMYRRSLDEPPRHLSNEGSIVLLGYCQLGSTSTMQQGYEIQDVILELYSSNGFDVFASHLHPLLVESNDFVVLERWADMDSFNGMLNFWDGSGLDILNIMGDTFTCGGDVFYERNFVRHGQI